MTKTNASILVGGLGLLGGIAMMIYLKKTSFWWWILLFFVVAPVMANIGYAIGRESESEKSKRLSCESSNKTYVRGVCL